MAYFQTHFDAREDAERLRRQEADAAIIRCNEACGGQGLHDTGRGDMTGEHVRARDEALAVANQRYKDRIAAAFRHFSGGASHPFGDGYADARHAQHWLETGEPDPHAVPSAPAREVLFYDRRGGEA